MIQVESTFLAMRVTPACCFNSGDSLRLPGQPQRAIIAVAIREEQLIAFQMFVPAESEMITAPSSPLSSSHRRG